MPTMRSALLEITPVGSAVPDSFILLRERIWDVKDEDVGRTKKEKGPDE